MGYKICRVFLLIITAVQCSSYNSLLDYIQNRLNNLEQKQKELREDNSVLFSKSASVEKEIINQQRQSNLKDEAVRQSLTIMKRSFSEEKQHTRKMVSEVKTSTLKNMNEIIDTVEDVKTEIGEIKSMQEKFFKHFDMFLESQTDSKSNLRFMKNRINSISGVIEDISQTLEKHADIQEITSKILWNTHGYSFYFIGKESVTWTEAVARCKTLGAYLTEVDNSEENTFLINLAKTNYEGSSGYGVWLGGNSEGHAGIWKWQHSKTNITFFDWDEGEPNGHKIENCLHMFRSQEWKWNDLRCIRKLGYICER